MLRHHFFYRRIRTKFQFLELWRWTATEESDEDDEAEWDSDGIEGEECSEPESDIEEIDAEIASGILQARKKHANQTKLENLKQERATRRVLNTCLGVLTKFDKEPISDL